MRLLFTFIQIIGIAWMFSSCERDITIDLPNAGPKIVIEGTIEDGQKPKVLVTRNQGFFNEFPTDLEQFIETFLVTDAQVVISDGVVEETMTLVLDFLNYPFAYYTTNVMLGQVNKTYSLSVVADGQVLSSITTIPPAVPLDTTWFILNPFRANEDSFGFANVRFVDPDTVGNAYRLFIKRRFETEYLPVFGSTYNDQFINGRTFEFFSGQGRRSFASSDTFVDSSFFFKLGDTIDIKFCSIGQKEFEFYSTYEAGSSTNGNPFASPVVIKSNINGGLGVWCGIGPYFTTLIATN